LGYEQKLGSHFLAVGSLTPPRAGCVAWCPAGELRARHTLANGLKIVVWPVQRHPQRCTEHWVRAGSRNEAPGITGLAHFSNT